MNLQPTFLDRLNHFKIWLLQFIIPEHIRRGMFIFSLSAWVLKQQSADAVLAKHLVEKLDLPSRPEVFFYAVDRSSTYWSGLEVPFDCKDHFCTETVKPFVERALKQMPVWMQYNTQRSMRNDAIRTLLVTHRHAIA